MRIIGVTGPSGAGKSMLCERFAKNGIPTINADGVYHSLLVPPSECLTALRCAFGDGVFTTDGALDRNALSKIVFCDEGKLQLLNSTVLGFVIKRIRLMINELEAKGSSCVVVDAPTLIESGFNEECADVISVLCPPEIRIKRIMERDGLDRASAEMRTRSQKSDSFYKEHSDYILINDGSEEYLQRIEELFVALAITD